jgi:DNA-binding LacI/PurR family transcriptional regulator
MSVTQREIAAKLNMSQAHVARILSGKGVASQKTRLRVEAAAREMGYDPYANAGAVAMNARRHGTPLRRKVIAVVFSLDEQPAKSTLRSVPFFMPVIKGMEDEAAKRDIDICLCPVRHSEIPRLIREKNVDGVVMMTDVESMRDLGLPKVMFHGKSEEGTSICPDDRDGARQATRHLLELGHRRIGFIGVRYHSGLPWEKRLDGYYDALKEYGIESHEEWVETDLAWPACMPTADFPGCGHCAACTGWEKLVNKNKAGKKTVSPPVTALVCYNDLIAMGAIVQARRQGILVPRDLSIVGFDDVSVQYQFSLGLTSVSLPLYEMGCGAISKLQDVIETENSDGEFQPFPVSLIVRESTAKVQKS